MTRYGYFLSSEEHEPQELVREAKRAEEAGFDALWISGRGGRPMCRSAGPVPLPSVTGEQR